MTSPQEPREKELRIADILGQAGNRSSVDDSRSDGPEDETTVVEPEQGNGEWIIQERGSWRELITDSIVTYYLPVATWRRFKSGCATNLHS